VREGSEGGRGGGREEGREREREGGSKRENESAREREDLLFSERFGRFLNRRSSLISLFCVFVRVFVCTYI